MTGEDRVIAANYKIGQMKIQESHPPISWNELQQEQINQIISGKHNWGEEPVKRGNWSQWFHSSKYVYNNSNFYDKPFLVNKKIVYFCFFLIIIYRFC